jgi:hypothetical protein
MQNLTKTKTFDGKREQHTSTAGKLGSFKPVKPPNIGPPKGVKPPPAPRSK